MNLKVGTIIKNLRAERNITQESLAAVIGVTPQAISRWESEGGYPDIELLPALADFFSISTDELLGYKLFEREEELIQIKKELRRLAEVGTHEEKLSFSRNALIKYPADAKIKTYLAACLFDEWERTKNESAVEEAENLCTSVMKECRDEALRYDAITTLSTICIGKNQPHKAKEVLDELVPLKFCREVVLSCGIGDGKTEQYIQDLIDQLADCLGLAICHLAVDEDIDGAPSLWDKKIEILNRSNQLYKLIYGDNLMFYHTRLCRNYWLISTYLTCQKKADETIEALEKMCYHAIEYDKSYLTNHGKFYTSILTDQVVYPEDTDKFHEFTEHTDSYRMKERMKLKEYDWIRTDPRFIAVIGKLDRYAK